MIFDASNRISPDKFVWEKFITKVGLSQTEIIKDWTKAPWELNPEWNLIGWVESKFLKIRQRDEGIAILVEDKESFEQVWLHWLT